MNWTKDFFDFLDSDYKTFHIKEDDRYYDFVKIQHNSFIDLLFINYNYYRKTTIGDKFEYCGFYDNKNKELYDINYILRKDIFKLEYDECPYKSIGKLSEELNVKVSDIVNNYVNDNKNEFYKVAEEYESQIVESDVYDYILDNKKEIKYDCNYTSSDNETVLLYFDNGKQQVLDMALSFIENNKEYIGKKLKDIDKENEHLNKIYDNPTHEIHKIKNIIDALVEGEYVNVRVFINKNNKDFNFKLPSSALKNSWHWDYISHYDLSATDRKEYENLFGREDLYYKDIYKIEYRNKTIYEDKNFNFELEKDKELKLEL